MRLCRVSFETKPLTRQQLKNKAAERWAMWRLVFDGKMDYNTVFHQMLPSEINEANAALDIYIETIKKANNSKK